MIADYFIFSIYLAGLLSLIRFTQISPEFRPFLWIVWLACLNESASAIIIRIGGRFYWNNNLYSLFEALIYLRLFQSVHILNHPFLRRTLPAVMVSIWLFDNLFLTTATNPYNSYFNLSSALLIVLLSIHGVNYLLFSQRHLLRNPIFWICTGAIFFFTYIIIVEVFWIYGTGIDFEFSGRIFRILSWVNLFTNLIFALAILLMQKRNALSLSF